MVDGRARPKVLAVVGTRPEAIKIAPVLHELRRWPEHLDPRLCVTAQHREMLDQVLEVFELVPDRDLDLMRERQSLDDATSSVISAVGRVLQEERPTVVLVVGDTTTGFGASLAAFYARVRVGHVEAGLRTRNRYSPFPEELLRKLMSHLTTFHFAPTRRAVHNLGGEDLYDDAEIYLTGNPVVDAMRVTVAHRVEAPERRAGERMILVTAHRRENFGQPLADICEALLEIADRNRAVRIVYPVHRNPNVSEVVYRKLGGRERIELLPPQDYRRFAYLMADSYFILTDSGGIQEEAPVLGKPVLVMRAETERPEAIEAGTARLVGTDPAKIIQTAERLLEDHPFYAAMSQAQSPFGDGHAAERIVAVLLQRLADVGKGADAYLARSERD